MTNSQSNQQPSEKNELLLNLFGRILPLVDGIADKLRLFLIIGILLLIWFGVWFGVLKKFTLLITASVVGIALIPLLILARFWWSLEELKNLPEIAGDMMGDAKMEVREQLQNLRQGKVPSLNLLTAGKNLWSIGAMLREGRELLGSYVSIATLVNPFILFLGVASIFIICIMAIISVILIFLL